MKPHERRQRLVEWLRARESVTADEAASRLGVSLRTLHRDIAALRLDGYTIHGEQGRGGGIRLDPLARPTAIEFDIDEAIGLYLTMRIIASAQTVPFANSAQSAVTKLGESLSPQRRKQIDRLMKRVVVGSPARNIVGQVTEIDGKLLSRLEESFRREKALRFEYREGERKAATHTVEPQGALFRNPSWYLLALEVGGDIPMMYRMDYIAKPRVLESVDSELRSLELFDELIGS